MKKLALLLSLTLLGGSLQAADLVESVIARVGDRIVTQSQYMKRLQDGYSEIRTSVPPDQVAEKEAEFRGRLLDDMLTELLLKDRADRLNITVTRKETDEAIDRLKKQYGIETDEQFDESLKQSGLTRSEMEARLRDTLLTNKVFARELRSRQEITDRELRERYDREREQYRLPERADLKEIIILLPTNLADTPAVRARAEEAANRARAGEDFGKLVEEYSQSPSKSQGGSLGTVARGELLPDLDGPVFKSQAPAIIGPIETKVGFHILQLTQRHPSEVPPFDTIKEKLRKDAGDETFQRDYKAYIETLKKDAFIQLHEDRIPKS